MIDTPERALGLARILIVDDELNNRNLLEVMLAQEGYLLSTASSGKQALAMVASAPPDLILLDIMMPDMDGYEVAARIKASALTRNIPIIMVTALTDPGVRMRGLSAGAEDFLGKPVDRAELVVRVRNLTRLKASGEDKYREMLEEEVGSRTADLLSRTRTLEQQTAVLTEQAALLDLAQDAIVVQDMDNRIVFWSRGAEVMYGWRSREALGQDRFVLLNIQRMESPGTVEATLLRQDQWEGEAIHHTRDGTPVIVASRWALQRDHDGVPFRVLTINNDITERRRTQTELQLLSERLSLATAVAKIGVWERDLKSNTLTWDATMFDIYGLPLAVPMPYEAWAAVVHSEDLAAVEVTLQRAIAETGQGASEYRIVLPDGKIRTVASVERVILDERGQPGRLIGVDMDVTERKEAEGALEQIRQDQLRFKDEFLSHVSHELRSPLTAIKQFTMILLGGIAGELNKEQREYQQIVARNIGQLQSMIDDLLEVTRLETGKLTVEPESVSVANAVSDTFDTLQLTARAKGVTLSYDLAEDLPSVYADPTRLRQILIILLDNAIQFTPSGGTVQVHARRLQENSRFLVIEVSDTGCGIPEQALERIFERLNQVSDPSHASRKGLGLGLYICKELVTRQGGHIWARPRPDEGSIFSFTLPVSSLDMVLAPLFKDDDWPAATAALVTVETSLLAPWPSHEIQEEWSREARNLLQRCLLPDLDVLLPTASCDPNGERFFMVAFADEKGVAVLCNRIRGQFARLRRVIDSGLGLSISYTMLPPPLRGADVSMSDSVATLATYLEEAIASHPQLADTCHE